MVKLAIIRRYFNRRSQSRSSSLNWSRVHMIAWPACGLNPVKSMSPAQYSSWLPMMHGIPMSRTIFMHSLGFGVVANHIAQAHVTCAVVFLCIFQHHLECLKVGVDVRY